MYCTLFSLTCRYFHPLKGKLRNLKNPQNWRWTVFSQRVWHCDSTVTCTTKSRSLFECKCSQPLRDSHAPSHPGKGRARDGTGLYYVLIWIPPLFLGFIWSDTGTMASPSLSLSFPLSLCLCSYFWNLPLVYFRSWMPEALAHLTPPFVLMSRWC